MILRTVFESTKLLRNLNVSESRRGVKTLVDIPWVRPKRPPCNSSGPDGSGDLVRLTPLPPTTPSPMFKEAKSLNDANDKVKTVFSIGHQGTRATHMAIIEQYVDRVRSHKYDNSSMEVKSNRCLVAKMTAKIRYYQDYLERKPFDIYIKTECKETIDKRKRFLKLLRKNDYKRFEWVLDKLDLVYKPSAVDVSEPVTRKKSLIKLLDMQCKAIKEKKMNAYKKTLLAKKEQLLKEFSNNPI